MGGRCDKVPQDVPDNAAFAPFYTQPVQSFQVGNAPPQVYDLDGDGVAEVVFSGYSRIMILDGRGCARSSPLDLRLQLQRRRRVGVDMNNDGHGYRAKRRLRFQLPVLSARISHGVQQSARPHGVEGWRQQQLVARTEGVSVFSTARRRSMSNSRVLHDHQGIPRLQNPGTAGHGARSAPGAGHEFHLPGEQRSGDLRAGHGLPSDRTPATGRRNPRRSRRRVCCRFSHPIRRAARITHYYDVAAIDPDAGDTVTFSLKSAPTWVTMSGPARLRFEPTCGRTAIPARGPGDGHRDGDRLIGAAPTRSSSSTSRRHRSRCPAWCGSRPRRPSRRWSRRVCRVSVGGEFLGASRGQFSRRIALAGAVVGQFDDITSDGVEGLAPV